MGSSLLSFNLHLNQLFNPAPRAALERVRVEPHFWGTSVEALQPAAVDIVLMAECVYDVDASRGLAKSLRGIVDAGCLQGRAEPPKFIMAYRHRNEADHLFFDALKELKFDVFERSRGSSDDLPT